MATNVRAPICFGHFNLALMYNDKEKLSKTAPPTICRSYTSDVSFCSVVKDKR